MGRPYLRNHRPGSAGKPPSRSRPRPGLTSPRAARKGELGGLSAVPAGGASGPREPGPGWSWAERRRARRLPAQTRCGIAAGPDLPAALSQGLLPRSAPRLHEEPCRRRGSRTGLGRPAAAGRAGLLVWRPHASLSGASCRSWSRTRCR